jgi:hypothetical protein
MTRTARSLSTLALAAIASAMLVAQETKEVYQGEAAETFLREARIARVTDLPIGVTQPRKVTLELDGVTHMAAFKIIDVDKPGATQLSNGTFEVAFQDSWKTEIAAYEIDRTIGLGMVPATVERTIRGKKGSLQWWVESMMPEAERIKQSVRPPDMDTWNKAVYKMRLFDKLIYNVDRHMNNILVTADFDLRLIDHSRAFRPFDELKAPDDLTMFSRSLLAGLERLEFDDLKSRLKKYLRDGQIRSMLKRRDAILALVKARVAKEGEAAVLYD